ncbi:MAG: hypothetical protein NE330_10500 [Lentisphaeraceae bacterium]|nr:hypothetical protein [Lentisphaeraceae bacterium]
MSSRLFKFRMEDSLDFFKELSEKELFLERDKHGLTCTENGCIRFALRLPLFYPRPEENQPFWKYLDSNNFDIYPENWNLLLMEAGRAAVGYVSEGKLVKHKNIRKYMVRKKQGKAQLTHLKSKGKSRYGSRLRLQETISYFDEILEKLDDEPYGMSRYIFYHCPVRLKAFLAEAADENDFDLSRYVWVKLGVSVKEASFDELKRLILEPFYTRLTVFEDSALEELPPIPAYRK